MEISLDAKLRESGAHSASFAYRIQGKGQMASDEVWGSWGRGIGENRAFQPEKHTQYDLASLTKLFTTTALLLLVEQKCVQLEQRVQFFLPDFLRSDVTLEMLLTHTSLLDVYLSHIRAKTPTEDALKQAIYTAGKMEGDYFYQDPNMILLGWIIEKVTDMGLAQYMEAAIFQPLEMRHTCFNPSAADIPATRLKQDGALHTGIVHDDTARIFGGVAGHAGLFSTALDMMKFLAAWNGESEILLKKSTLEKALRPRYTAPDGNFAQALGWKLHSPRHNVAPFLQGGHMHGGFTGTFCLMSEYVDLVVLTDFVYPGERTQEERERWWCAMRECVQMFLEREL